MQEDHHFCRWHLPEGFSAEAALAAAFPGASRAQAAHQLDSCSPKELRVGAAAASLAVAAAGWPQVVVGVGAEAASAAHYARMTHRLPCHTCCHRKCLVPSSAPPPPPTTPPGELWQLFSKVQGIVRGLGCGGAVEVNKRQLPSRDLPNLRTLTAPLLCLLCNEQDPAEAEGR